MLLREAVAKNLKSYRVKSGLTQAEVSNRTKINIRHISQIENGTLNLTLDTIERLAIGLGIVAAELLRQEGNTLKVQGAKEEVAGLEAAIRILKGYKAQIDIGQT